MYMFVLMCIYIYTCRKHISKTVEYIYIMKIFLFTYIYIVDISISVYRNIWPDVYIYICLYILLVGADTKAEPRGKNT